MRTTQERISDLIEFEFEFYPSKTEGRCEVRCDDNGNKAGIEYCAKKIAAEIDQLTHDLAWERAEVKRLMPLPEIYEAWQKIILDGSPSRDTVAEFVEIAHAAAMRAASAPPNLNPLPNKDAEIAGLKHDVERLAAEVEHWRNAAGVTDGPASDGVSQL